MGAGEYLSSRAYNNYVKKEKEREAWELENYPEGEIIEMVELFVHRGMSQPDADLVIRRMAKYKDFFVNLMMREELSLPVPGDDDVAEGIKDGFVMFLSFAAFGMLPILGFSIVPVLMPGLEDHTLFAVACLITAFALLMLGAFKARFHDKAYLRSGLETLLLGGACASVAFLVGRAVASFADANMSELFVTPAT